MSLDLKGECDVSVTSSRNFTGKLTLWHMKICQAAAMVEMMIIVMRVSSSRISLRVQTVEDMVIQACESRE